MNQSNSSHGGRRAGAGRKPGSGQAAHYRAMLEPHAGSLIQQVVDMAKAGDMAAIKLCLDRLCAPLRPTDAIVNIEGIADCNELAAKGQLVLDNIASGNLTPIEGSNMIRSISSQANILRVDDFEKRISELEARANEH